MNARPSRTWPLAWCLVLSASPVLAQSVWSGDFRNGDFSAYGRIYCGAYSGGGSCPGGVQDNPTPSTVEPACPAPDEAGCRFTLTAPPPSPPGKYTPAGPALRVVVAHTPDAPQGDEEGDRAPGLNQPWGRDHRNELVNPLDGAAARAPDLGNPGSYRLVPGYYTEGDERWFGWSTYIPRDDEWQGTFPDPTVSRSTSPNWHVLFQIHSVGACDANGPNLSIGIDRTDGDQGAYETGTRYQFTLNKRDTYSTSDALNYTPGAAPGRDGHYRLWPHYDPANGRFNPVSTATKGEWHTFVLHVVFSANPNKGVVELWMDGVKRYPGTGDPSTRATLYRFPSTPCAGEDMSWFIAGKPMPVYVATGLYRSRFQLPTDTLYQADLKSTADTNGCRLVDPLQGQNCPPVKRR